MELARSLHYAPVIESRRIEAERLSKIGNENRRFLEWKSLKTLSMLAAFQDTKRSILSFPKENLSPALRKELLSHLESRGKEQSYLVFRKIYGAFPYKYGLTAINMSNFSQYQNEVIESIEPGQRSKLLAVLNHLLDSSVKRFDFQAFPQFHEESEMQIWQMLREKCTSLEEVSDSRTLEDDYFTLKGFKPLNISTFLPFLTGMKNLLHLDLLPYVLFNDEDMDLIARCLPNLQTLCITLRMASFNLLASLFQLQKLEVLKISWLADYEIFDLNRLKSAQFQLVNESLLHLPRLRVCCNDNSKTALQFGFHEIHPLYRPHNTLPLEHLRVSKKIFPFELTPCLKSLCVNNAYRQDFSKCPRVTSLFLANNVPKVDNMALNILGLCLEELAINSVHHEFDPFDIFMKCPKLKKATFSFKTLVVPQPQGLIGPDRYLDDRGEIFRPNSPEHPQSGNRVDLSHFNRLRYFKYEHETSKLSSEFVTHVLQAPNLEYFLVYYRLELDPEDLKLLSSLLSERKILQELQHFEFAWDSNHHCREFEEFLVLLPVYAPKLKNLKTQVCNEMFTQLYYSVLPLLKISNFCYWVPVKTNRDFMDG